MDFFDELVAQLKKEAKKKNSFAVNSADWEQFLDPGKKTASSKAPAITPSAPEKITSETSAVITSAAVGNNFSFDSLASEITGCRSCPLAKVRKNPAVSYGDRNAKLMIVIEVPSLLDDEENRIFSGEVGALLDKMLLAMGLAREETYICSIVKCRTPGNRPASAEEIKICRERFFDAEVKAVKPECILAFGAGFAKNILHREGTISNLRGTFDSYDGIPVMSTFNPAYLLRQPSAKKTVWGDLQMVMKALGLK